MYAKNAPHRLTCILSPKKPHQRVHAIALVAELPKVPYNTGWSRVSNNAKTNNADVRTKGSRESDTDKPSVRGGVM